MPKGQWDPERYEAQHSFVWRYGQGLIDLLDPKPGERILDLGCGPGQLTQQIADRGAHVLGLDASPEMIGQARQNYPNLKFTLQDAASMGFEGEFDAVFSNAALHWMLDAQAVANAIARALRRGGRLVAELGGKGNVRYLEEAIEAVAARYHREDRPAKRTHYPSIAEYAGILEAAGLEVSFAELFDRPTLLDGEDGIENWVRQFKWYYFEGLPAEESGKALREVTERVRPTLRKGEQWFADYRRLRLRAVKLEEGGSGS